MNPYYSNYSGTQRGVLAGASFMDSVMKSYSNALGLMANIDNVKYQRNFQREQFDFQKEKYESQEAHGNRETGFRHLDAALAYGSQAGQVRSQLNLLESQRAKIESRKKAASQQEVDQMLPPGTYSSKFDAELEAVDTKLAPLKSQYNSLNQKSKLYEKESYNYLGTKFRAPNTQAKGTGGQVEASSTVPESQERDWPSVPKQGSVGPIAQTEEPSSSTAAGDTVNTTLKFTDLEPGIQHTLDSFGLSRNDLTTENLQIGGKTREGFRIITSDSLASNTPFAVDPKTGNIYETETEEVDGVPYVVAKDRVSVNEVISGGKPESLGVWEEDDQYVKLNEELEKGGDIDWDNSWLSGSLKAVASAMLPDFIYHKKRTEMLPEPDTYSLGIVKNLLDTFEEVNSTGYYNGDNLPPDVLEKTINSATSGIEKAYKDEKITREEKDKYLESLGRIKLSGKISFTREFEGKPVTVSAPLNKTINKIMQRTDATEGTIEPDIENYIAGLFWPGRQYTQESLDAARIENLKDVLSSVNESDSAQAALGVTVVDNEGVQLPVNASTAVSLIANENLDIIYDELTKPKGGVLQPQNRLVEPGSGIKLNTAEKMFKSARNIPFVEKIAEEAEELMGKTGKFYSDILDVNLRNYKLDQKLQQQENQKKFRNLRNFDKGYSRFKAANLK